MEAAGVSAAPAPAAAPKPLGQGCNPHLKKVLKSYQLSAQRSLHGPSKLATSVLVNMTAGAGGAGDASVKVSSAALADARPPKATSPEPAARARSRSRSPTPPGPSRPSPASSGSGAEAPAPPSPRPFIHSAPLLSAADRGEDGRAERVDTGLEGELIACFVVGGEKRLCLPQVLNSVLRDFSLNQINSVCDELHIYCSRCNAEQLEQLQATGTLPATAASCGLITQTDAERLCAALLPRGVAVKDAYKDGKAPAADEGFQVYHECFGRAAGLCRPDEPLARSIECLECRLLFGPQQFVSHAHRHAETSTVHWGFDSSNWRAYLLLTEDQQAEQGQEELQRRLAAYKQRAEERLKRKQVRLLPAGKGKGCVCIG
ncbi:Transforming protein Ski [Frankliniella fusca]|uniref:Transforming protein Ski n=1 Tax=Frankliniella fusca TaxID=407009 RepID=A0AAE1H571_9NEOP|nr:Transforming protein Ski [Frankliniella fusca]